MFLVYEEGYTIKDSVDRLVEDKKRKKIHTPIDDLINTQDFGELRLEGRADYNVLNFINNIFLFDERLQEFIKALWKMIEPFYFVDNIFDCLKVIEKLKNKVGFYKDMYDWTIQYGGMVVPVYSMDIYYNMLKRLARTQQLSNERYIETARLYQTFYNLLEEIQAHLKKNDEYYGEERYFTNCFKECPFIREIKMLRDSIKEGAFIVEEVNRKVEVIRQYNNFVDQIICHSDNKIETHEERILRETEIL